MSYNLELREQAVAGELNIFDSEKIRWITGGVTIDHETVTADEKGNKILAPGTPLGKITETGKYGPWEPAVAGVAASGTTTVDSVAVTIEGDADDVYNGVVISFADDAESGAAAAAWSEGTLTVTLEDAVDYDQDAINNLIAAATVGAPTGVDPTKIKIKTTVETTGAKWGAAEDVVLAGGVDAIAAADDGRQTAVLMLGETVDFSLGSGYGFGDQVVAAFDDARVITARLPVDAGKIADLKQQLTRITFS